MKYEQLNLFFLCTSEIIEKIVLKGLDFSCPNVENFANQKLLSFTYLSDLLDVGGG